MTNRAASSPFTRRDLALMGVACGIGSALVAICAVLAYGGALATVLCGGPWRAPAVRQWLGVGIGVLEHPLRLQVGLPAPWGPALAGHAAVYWGVTAGLGLLAIGIAAVAARSVWWVAGPMPAGHASRADLRRELSPAAARRTARWTRPSLDARARRRVPIEELAFPSHRGPHGTRLWIPLENPTGCVAPTQSGKSRGDLVHKALSAPGALLCSTSKPDLLEFSALARSRRGGPVYVWDATGTVQWPAMLQWSIVDGCRDPREALRRANSMVEAASIDLSEVTGNDKVFRSRAKTVLQAYYMAAALTSSGPEKLVSWGMTRDAEPVNILVQQPGYAEYGFNLRKELTMVAETADAVWMSVRRVLEPLMDPALQELCSPAPGAGFNVEAALRAQASVYIVAEEQQAAQVAPLLTAFCEHWINTARGMALETEHNRLDPVATALLDELPNATPIPLAPRILADTASRGVPVHWAAQSIAQLEGSYGALGARQLLDNTTFLSIYPGLKDEKTLQWISTLSSHKERIRYQQFADGALTVGRTSLGTETVPVYRAGEARTMARGRVLVIYRNLPPIEARLIDVSRRRDWPTLRHDMDNVRRGTTGIGSDGYRRDRSPATANFTY